MLAFAIVCAAYAALVSIQNIVLSRRLDHWRAQYIGLRQEHAEKYRESQESQYAQLVMGEHVRLVGKARGGTPPKGDAA